MRGTFAMLVLFAGLTGPAKGGPSTACQSEDARFDNADGGCRDRTSGTVWRGDKREGLSYAAARRFCQTFTGYADWRLPTRQELERLAGQYPADALGLPIRVGEWFWADSGEETQGLATFVNVRSGEVESRVDKRTINAAVICARSRPESHRCRDGAGRFATAGGGCRDESGLIWSLPSAQPMPTQSADRYCDRLAEGGYRDWRLPSRAELEQAWGLGSRDAFRYDFALPFTSALVKYADVILGDCTREREWLAPEEPPWGFCYGRHLVHLGDGRHGVLHYREGILWGNGKYTDYTARGRTPFPVMCVRGPSACSAGPDTTGKWCGLWDANRAWIKGYSVSSPEMCTRTDLRITYPKTMTLQCRGSSVRWGRLPE